MVFPACSPNVLDYGATKAPNRAMAMLAPKPDDRSRQNLRLDPRIWTAIDRARMKRAGNISRNTWITEAIEEKLTREEGLGDRA